MCVVTRDRISGRLVRLLDARDSSGKTFLQALSEVSEEQKRITRNALRASASLPIPWEDSKPIN